MTAAAEPFSMAMPHGVHNLRRQRASRCRPLLTGTSSAAAAALLCLLLLACPSAAQSGSSNTTASSSGSAVGSSGSTAPASGGSGGGGGGGSNSRPSVAAAATASPSSMAPAPGAVDSAADVQMAREAAAIVYGDPKAAMEWYSSPQLVDPAGDTTILHGIERMYGANTLPNIREVNRVIIKAANEALAALQIKFKSRYVVTQASNGTVPWLPSYRSYQGFDLFFSVTLAKGVMLRSPLTADLVQLASIYIFSKLSRAGLAEGGMLLGITFPQGFRNPGTTVSTALLSSVLKVAGPQLLPFAVEKQTLLLRALHERAGVTSPIASINVTAPSSLDMVLRFPPANRRLLRESRPIETFFIGIDMVVASAEEVDPAALFRDLLGDREYARNLTSLGMPILLEWVNTTATTFQLLPDGTEQFVTKVITAAGSGGSSVPGGGRVLAPGDIIGIGIAGCLCIIAVAGGCFVWRRHTNKAQKRQQRPRSCDSGEAGIKDQHETEGSKGSTFQRTMAKLAMDSATSLEVRSSGRKGSSERCSGSNMASTLGRSPPRRSSVAGVSAISADEISICKRPDGSDWLLGSGSFGQVFKGMRRNVQEVAIKKLRPDSSESAWFPHLDREIAILSSVSFDRNIVQYYGACLDEQDQSWGMLVMEYMAGGDLRQAFCSDDNEEYAWSAKGRRVALDVAKGLHFLHSCGVVHRDLKTSNCLLTAEGVAKICDVGLAKIMTHGDATSWDRTAGTFAYCSPELILGVRCTEKVDIYSYGVVLWEIVTHEQPIRGQLRDLEVPGEAPQEVQDLIDACLQPNPDKRPTAAQLVERLQAIPEQKRPPGIRRHSGAPLAKNIGRDNGQNACDRSHSGPLPSVKSPGLVDADALLKSLLSS